MYYYVIAFVTILHYQYQLLFVYGFLSLIDRTHWFESLCILIT
jgi:hypothetical protein